MLTGQKSCRSLQEWNITWLKKKKKTFSVGQKNRFNISGRHSNYRSISWSHVLYTVRISCILLLHSLSQYLTLDQCGNQFNLYIPHQLVAKVMKKKSFFKIVKTDTRISLTCSVTNGLKYMHYGVDRMDKRTVWWKSLNACYSPENTVHSLCSLYLTFFILRY